MTGRRDLLWRATLTPEAPAIETAAGTWSFADLADRARRAAAHVQSVAPPGEAPIGLLLTGDARFAAWFHAIASSGRTVLPLNLRLTAAELAQQLASARARWVLGEADDAGLGSPRTIRLDIHGEAGTVYQVRMKAAEGDVDGAAVVVLGAPSICN